MNLFRIVIVIFIGTHAALNALPPLSEYYETIRPDVEMLAGSYKFGFHQMSNYEQQLSSKIEKLKKAPEIVLSADGSFRVDNFPTWIEYEPYRYRFGGFVIAKGTWSLVIVGRMDDGKNGVLEHWGIKLNGLNSAENQPTLLNRANNFEIAFIFGDPDSGEIILFEKKQESTSEI